MIETKVVKKKLLRIFSLHLWPEVSQHERMNKKIIPNEILFQKYVR